MRTLTCIVCPQGCTLSVEETPAPSPAEKNSNTEITFTVSGNRCPRGAAYAREEIRAPKRTVTATCAVAGTGSAAVGPAGGCADQSRLRRIPVKTSQACPKERIPELLKDIYAHRITLPIKAGDIVIPNWRQSGIDIVAVRTLG
jgi:CxxC motif-containing protein